MTVIVDRVLCSRPVYLLGWLVADLAVSAALILLGKRLNRP